MKLRYSMTTLLMIILCALCLIQLTACAGGGGSSSEETSAIPGDVFTDWGTYAQMPLAFSDMTLGAPKQITWMRYLDNGSHVATCTATVTIIGDGFEGLIIISSIVRTFPAPTTSVANCGSVSVNLVGTAYKVTSQGMIFGYSPPAGGLLYVWP